MSISASTRPAMVRKGKVLVILSFGSVAWYRPTRPMVTVGELRRQVAKAIGRIVDGEVVGVELVFTDSKIAPELTTPLRTLTHCAHRNVCFDVTSVSGSCSAISGSSFGERLLRRHLRQQCFQSGIDQQLWRLIELRWPYAVFGLRRTVMSGEACEVALRLRFDRYPLVPPLVEVWNTQTRSAVKAECWPRWFIRFVREWYPQLANIEAAAYSPHLLRISTAIARRLKHKRSEGWEVSHDFTQVLTRASCCFRASDSRSQGLRPSRTRGSTDSIHRNAPVRGDKHSHQISKGGGGSISSHFGLDRIGLHLPTRIDPCRKHNSYRKTSGFSRVQPRYTTLREVEKSD